MQEVEGSQQLEHYCKELPERNTLIHKFTFFMYTTINTLIPTKFREFPERIFVREILEKTKIDSSTILDI